MSRDKMASIYALLRSATYFTIIVYSLQIFKTRKSFLRITEKDFIF